MSADPGTTVFRSASAVAGDWSRALRTCLAQLDPLPPNANFGLIYLSAALAPEVDALLAGLRSATGIERWVGAAGSAIFRPGHKEPLGPGLAVMVGSLPERSVQLLDPTVMPPGADGELALVHFTAGSSAVSQALARTAHDTNLVLMGASMHGCTNPVSIAGGLSEGSLTGVSFSARLPLLPLVARAGITIGKPCRIDGRGQETLSRLDGRPALELLLERCGDLTRRRPATLSDQIAIGMSENGGDVRTVARLRAVDEANGTLILDRVLPQTEQIHFLRRDGSAAQASLRAAASDLAARLEPRRVKALIYYLPDDRQRYLLGPNVDEIGLVRDILGMPPTIGVAVDQVIVAGKLESMTALALAIA